jgi:hypothetical protein
MKPTYLRKLKVNDSILYNNIKPVRRSRGGLRLGGRRHGGRHGFCPLSF